MYILHLLAIMQPQTGSYTASGFTLNNGYELLFLNGTVVNAQDYDIAGQNISFVGNATGDLQIIQWSQNNLAQPNGSPVKILMLLLLLVKLFIHFSYNINAFNLFSNGGII